MKKSCFPKCRPGRLMGGLQLVLGSLVIIMSSASLFRFYSAGFFMQKEDICNHLYGFEDGYGGFDATALNDRIGEVLNRMDALQQKLEEAVQQMEKNKEDLYGTNITKLQHKKYLEEQVIMPLYSAHIMLRQIRLPTVQGIGNSTMEEPLINTFVTEEIRKYITPKKNRVGKLNMFGSEKTYSTIGHACVLVRKELQRYMDYDIGSFCKDDWNLAQKLMINGCDPLPRRRCLTRASKVYQKPYPINESLWELPDDRNVRWSNYQCRNFACLSSKNLRTGFTKCTGCFEMEKEKLKWVTNSSSLPVDFMIRDVLAIKPGEMRIGLDYGVGTGTFAARMREMNVTVVTTALNLGAPFNEMIALRGLIPLYITLNQRLPFFDNTMDLIHTGGLMDGWLDLLLMDFILYDWDRVLRPGGLLWIDRFFCNKKDLDDYMYMFLQLRYRKHKWMVAPKSKDDVYLSAVLEKPPRAI